MGEVPRRTFLMGAGATVAAVSTGQGASVLTPVGANAAERVSPSQCPIDTIVIVTMENRSFDHMLGRLPGVNGLRRGMFNLDEDGERVYVHRQKDMLCTVGDLNHSRAASVNQWDGGHNGRFVVDTGTQAMGYMSEREIPWMHAMARNYTVFDRWHCSLLGPTWPNRSYIHAGTSGGRVSNAFDEGQLGMHERTLWNQLYDKGVSWGHYFTDVPFAGLYVNLLLANMSLFQPVGKFYEDAAAGNLPQVAMVEPGYLIGTDDHPPVSVQPGQRFMADVVAACMHSPQWDRMAGIVTYDEHGGFFDHVAPPVLPDDHPELGRPAGFRVPTMLISPWARRGAVAGRVHDHTSIGKFVQWRFGLPPLTTRQEAANNILYAFDFSEMRTDLPAAVTPPIDDELTRMCLMGRFLGPYDAINLPGGEGKESRRLWEDANLTLVSRLASTLQSPPAQAIAVAQPEKLQIVSAQPELEYAISQGLIPKEVDLRPQPGRPTPNPFLDRSTVAGPPAWKRKVRTATRRRKRRRRRH